MATDPHMAWEAERQALKPRFKALSASEAAGKLTSDEYTKDHDALMDIAHELLTKIKTTPARTIEGALLQIEVIDRENQECEPGDDQDGDISARAMAIGTIRRCLGASATPPASDPQSVSSPLARLIESYHVTFDTWKEIDEAAEGAQQLFDNHHALAAIIAGTPAHNRADAAAKLKLAAYHVDWTPERAEADDLGPMVTNAAAAIQEAIAWLER